MLGLRTVHGLPRDRPVESGQSALVLDGEAEQVDVGQLPVADAQPETSLIAQRNIVGPEDVLAAGGATTLDLELPELADEATE